MDEDAKRSGSGGVDPEAPAEGAAGENVCPFRPRARREPRGLRRISLADLTRVAAFVAAHDGE